MVVPSDQPLMTALEEYCKKVDFRTNSDSCELFRIFLADRHRLSYKYFTFKTSLFSQIGTDPLNSQLVFDGWTVLLGETPESLGMDDGDMVEVAKSGC